MRFLVACEMLGGVVSAYRYHSYKDPPKGYLYGNTPHGMLLYFIISCIQNVCNNLLTRSECISVQKSPIVIFPLIVPVPETQVIRIFTINTPH